MGIVFYHNNSDIAEGILEIIRDKYGFEVEVIKGNPKIIFKENLEYLGYPYGLEIRTLHTILEMLKGEVSLPLNVAKRVVKSNAEIMVFVTPTCPYCVLAAVTAAKFAIFNKNIKVKIIDATFYPELADEYNVFAVPKIVVKKEGKVYEWEGALPEDEFAKRI